jgi:putative SOS response-associated peptidase YedK
MCGRYTHLYTWRQIHDQLEGFLTSLRSALAEAEGPELKYNVAPRSEVPVVAVREGTLTPAMMRWWLVPHWSRTPDSKYATFNARSEDAHTKPAFRSAFRKGRCIVPASGFYEWRKNADDTKTPMYITRADGQPLLFAGLTDAWGDASIGPQLETCTVLTTTPNAEMARVHNRMPCVLEPEQVEAWVDADRSVDDARSLLRPAADGLLVMHEVGRDVGRVTNQGAHLIEPVG